MNYLKVTDLESYNIAYELSNYVWSVVSKWDNFSRFSIGQQYVNAVDSISANIAEGFGRYTKKDKIRFYQIARGSLLESVDWSNKAKARGLITEEEYNKIYSQLEKLPKSINSLIKYTNEKLTI